nr:MAG TPA: hypothetical protein [Caudoviricetes sp.]
MSLIDIFIPSTVCCPISIPSSPSSLAVTLSLSIVLIFNDLSLEAIAGANILSKLSYISVRASEGNLFF